MTFRSIRKGSSVLLVVVAASIAGISQAHAQAFRIEVHPIATRSVTASQILNGTSDGPAVTIAGELRLPVTSVVRLPVVVFMHGDAGAVANQPPWIDQFNAMGVAVFTLDSFSGRGFVSRAARIGPIDGTDAVGGLVRVADAYAALAMLSAHPRIDPTRIVLMGVSSGANTALRSAMLRFSRMFKPAGPDFAGFIALYPSCNVKLHGDEQVDRAPIRIFSGAADNVTLASACSGYVETLKRAGADAGFTAYAEALHGFDNPAGLPLTRVPDGPNFAACKFEEAEGGSLVNAATHRPPEISDTCVTQGFSAGRNAQADAEVRAAVSGLLQQWFKLDKASSNTK